MKTYGTKQKVYGLSVSAGLAEQKTLDAATGTFLDARVHCPGACEGTVRKWRRQLERREQNERLKNLRETVR